MVMFLRRKVTQRWLDRQFAPVRRYLKEHYPAELEKMVDLLMFMGEYEGQYEYKNSMTRDRIVLDQAGQVLYCGSAALEYEFDFRYKEEVIPLDDLYIHPNVVRWVLTNMSRKEQDVYGGDVRVLLQRVIGPRVNYDFDTLRTGDPLGRNTASLFLRLGRGSRYVFYFVGKRDVRYEATQMLMACEGWRVIVVNRAVLESQLPLLEQIVEEEHDILEVRR